MSCREGLRARPGDTLPSPSRGTLTLCPHLPWGLLPGTRNAFGMKYPRAGSRREDINPKESSLDPLGALHTAGLQPGAPGSEVSKQNGGDARTGRGRLCGKEGRLVPVGQTAQP